MGWEVEEAVDGDDEEEGAEEKNMHVEERGRLMRFVGAPSWLWW